MRSHFIALVTLPLSAVACGNAGIPHPQSSDPVGVEVATAKKPVIRADDDMPFIDEIPGEEETLGATASAFAEKKIGDRTVHRFSGSFSKTALILTQEVVARAGSLIMVDYVLEDGETTTKLRVTHDVGSDRVLRVRELRGKKELPSTAAAFEKLMARTSFAPDDNEAELAKEKGTCLVGSESIECEKTAYRVKVGDKTATFSVARSRDGRDVSGEISDEAGGIIYKAELIESRSGLPAGVASR
jgi:hypothetical protein